jgi:CHAT domain-containing protein
VAGTAISTTLAVQANRNEKQANENAEEARKEAKRADNETTRANQAATNAVAEAKRAAQTAYMLRQALTALQARLEDDFASLSDRQRLALLDQLISSLDFYLSSDTPDPPGQLYERVLGFKGVVAYRAAEERLLWDDRNLRPLLKELRETRSDLARLSYTPHAGEKLADRRKQFEALEERKEAIEFRLARMYAANKRPRRPIDGQQVSKALPPDTALVEFVGYRHWSPQTKKSEPSIVEHRLLAFVVRPGQEPICLRLGPAAPVESAIGGWQRAIQHGSPSVARYGMALRRLLWEPLIGHLGGAKTVLIAPDGPLWLLSFAALPGNKPNAVLLEEFAIGYLTSGRQLLDQSAEERLAGMGLLVLGGLDYGEGKGGGAIPAEQRDLVPAGRFKWPPLPGTRLEARRVQTSFCKAFPKARACLLEGAKGDRSALLREFDPSGRGNRWRYVHLATHGFFDERLHALLRLDDFGRAYHPLLKRGVGTGWRQPGQWGWLLDGRGGRWSGPAGLRTGGSQFLRNRAG